MLLKNKKSLSLFLILFIVSNIFINIAYSISNTYHQCDDERCEVCINIEQSIENVTKNQIDIKVLDNSIYLEWLNLLYIIPDNLYFKSHKTLISLKVRLDI